MTGRRVSGAARLKIKFNWLTAPDPSTRDILPRSMPAGVCDTYHESEHAHDAVVTELNPKMVSNKMVA